MHIMVTSESELIARRLSAIKAEKDQLAARLEELVGEESRLSFALDVFREFAGSASEESDIRVGRVTVNDHEYVKGNWTRIFPERVSLESTILNVLKEAGMTSAEVADTVALFAEAKRESVMSTLSRMVGKGLVRRDGKTYFPVRKGEGSEAVAASNPSSATKSEPGHVIGDDEL